jgi:hypothetical protein
MAQLNLDLDFAVIPKELRSIYKSEKVKVGEVGNNVIDIQHVEPPSSIRGPNNNNANASLKKKQMFDHFGKPLVWSCKLSAFVTNDLPLEPNLTTTNDDEESQIQKTHFKTLDEKFENSANFDTKLLHLMTMDEDTENEFHWDDIAFYVLQRSSAIKQSLNKFGQTLDQMRELATNHTAFIMKERKLIQFYLQIKNAERQ